MKKLIVLLPAAALVLATPRVDAGTIFLKNGSEVEGQIIEVNDKYIVVSFKNGTLEVERKSVESVEFADSDPVKNLGAKPSPAPAAIDTAAHDPKAIAAEKLAAEAARTEATGRRQRAVDEGALAFAPYQIRRGEVAASLGDDAIKSERWALATKKYEDARDAYTRAIAATLDRKRQQDARERREKELEELQKIRRAQEEQVRKQQEDEDRRRQIFQARQEEEQRKRRHLEDPKGEQAKKEEQRRVEEERRVAEEKQRNLDEQKQRAITQAEDERRKREQLVEERRRQEEVAQATEHEKAVTSGRAILVELRQKLADEEGRMKTAAAKLEAAAPRYRALSEARQRIAKALEDAKQEKVNSTVLAGGKKNLQTSLDGLSGVEAEEAHLADELGRTRAQLAAIGKVRDFASATEADELKLAAGARDGTLVAKEGDVRPITIDAPDPAAIDALEAIASQGGASADKVRAELARLAERRGRPSGPAKGTTEVEHQPKPDGREAPAKIDEKKPGADDQARAAAQQADEDAVVADARRAIEQGRAKKQAAADELARKQAADEQAQRERDELAKKQAADEQAERERAELARKQLADEQAKRQEADELAATAEARRAREQAQNDLAAKKQTTEEEGKRQQEELAKKEEARRQEAEEQGAAEEARRTREAALAAKKQTADDEAKRQQEELAKKQTSDDATKRMAEETAAAEDIVRRAREQATAKHAATDEEAKRQQDELAKKQAADDEAKRQQDELAKKQGADDAAKHQEAEELAAMEGARLAREHAQADALARKEAAEKQRTADEATAKREQEEKGAKEREQSLADARGALANLRLELASAEQRGQDGAARAQAIQGQLKNVAAADARLADALDARTRAKAFSTRLASLERQAKALRTKLAEAKGAANAPSSAADALAHVTALRTKVDELLGDEAKTLEAKNGGSLETLKTDSKTAIAAIDGQNVPSPETVQAQADAVAQADTVAQQLENEVARLGGKSADLEAKRRAAEEQRLAEELRKAGEPDAVKKQEEELAKKKAAEDEKRRQDELVRATTDEELAKKQAEEKRRQDEIAKAAAAEEARLADEKKKQEELAAADGKKRQEEEARLADEKKKQEELAAADGKKRQEEEARLADEKKKQEELAAADGKKRQEEEARLVDEKKKQEELAAAEAKKRHDEEARLADEKKKQEELAAAEARRPLTLAAEPTKVGTVSFQAPQGWDRQEKDGVLSYRGKPSGGVYPKLNVVTIDADGLTPEALAMRAAEQRTAAQGFKDVRVDTRKIGGKSTPIVTATVERNGKQLIHRQALVAKDKSIVVVTLSAAAARVNDFEPLFDKCVESVR